VCKLLSGNKLLPIMYAWSGQSLVASGSIFVKVSIHGKEYVPVDKPALRGIFI